MKNIKIIIILLIMLILFVTIGIAVLVLSSQINPSEYTDETEYEPTIIVEETLEKVTIRNNYYTVKKIIEDYYDCLCRLNETEEDVLIYEEDIEEQNNNNEKSPQDEIKRKRIYSYFEEEAINEMGLTVDNIQEKLGNYKDLYILINDMYVRDITETVKIYFIDGYLTEKENSQKEEFGLMVATDSQNSTFNIYTSEYIKKHNLYELSKDKEFKDKYFNIESIENRIYNKYAFEAVNDEKYSRDLLNSFTQSIKYNNIDYSYERLHENYKIGSFQEKSDYEKYIQKNREKITVSNLKYYQVKNVDGYKQYICVDGKENYYIFNETAIMDYTLILDEYTVDLPEFIEKYKDAPTQEKVGMNIEKIISAINNKDYKYVYNKLDNTFKNSQFPTEDSFETYIETNLYNENSIEYTDFSEEGGLCIYKTKITNKSDLQSKNLNIIMKLGEETNFTMSFSIQ